MFIFKIGSDEVRVRTDEEFKSLNDDEKISYVWNDLWPDDLGMTWIERVLYDHDTGDLGLPEIWDEYVSEFYPERYREIENEEPEDRHKKSGLIFEFIDDLEDKEFSRALLFLVNKVYDESLYYDWLIDSTKEQEGVSQAHIKKNNSQENPEEFFEELILNHTKAIEINPQDWKSYFERGMAKIFLENFEGSIEDFDKAIEINPQDWESFRNRGISKSSIGEYKSSIEDFNKAIEINPNDDVSYCNRGSVKFRTKDKIGAIKDWEKGSILGNEMSTGFLKIYK